MFSRLNASFLNVVTLKMVLHFIMIRNIGGTDLEMVGGEMLVLVLDKLFETYGGHTFNDLD